MIKAMAVCKENTLFKFSKLVWANCWYDSASCFHFGFVKRVEKKTTTKLLDRLEITWEYCCNLHNYCAWFLLYV